MARQSREKRFRLADRYYILMFASQAPGNPPEESHTFAVFVRETPHSPTSSSFGGDRIISWLPDSLPIKPFGSPVKGRGYSLKETLTWALGIGKVWGWGAFEIKQELYDKATRRVDQLESGSVKYVMIDDAFGSRPNRATNCIHALSDLGITPYLLLTGMKWGRRASVSVLRYFLRNQLIIEPLTTTPAVATYCGMDGVDIIWVSDLR
jgi:hypothetical protein